MCSRLCLILMILLGAAESPTGLNGLDSLSPRKQEELIRNRQRFDQLSAADQNRLRELYAAINADPEAERLKLVMERYHQWLKALPAGQRIELLDLPPEERLEQIRALRRREERQQFNELAARDLTVADRKAILDWVYSITQPRERALRLLSADQRRRFQRLDASARQRMYLFALRRKVAGDRSTIDRLRISDAEIRQLAEKASPPAREALEAVSGRGQKRTLVQRWIVAAIFSRSMPRIDPDNLRRFRQGLDDASKDYLENLPRDQMRVELQRMYINRRIRGR